MENTIEGDIRSIDATKHHPEHDHAIDESEAPADEGHEHTSESIAEDDEENHHPIDVHKGVEQ